ncbi:probable gluconokinase, partial [Aplysia californica]|uniref:Gluconokinase n=1 Tax=Aplysia californica TaxID=6500 RepID=A0ABM0ZYZ0_APLCA
MVVLVIMGVSGSGKSSVAEKLAEKLSCSSKDADEFHSMENKKKMTEGTPLTDEDRLPWLLAIHAHIQSLHGQTGIVTCSALKKMYRKILLNGHDKSIPRHSDVLFFYLKGSYELLAERLSQRKNHFMPPSLLKSQLETLEEPDDSEKCLTLDISESLDSIVSRALHYLQSCGLS